jgi:acetyltransferase
VGRLSRSRETNEAEAALAVSDTFQQQGLGPELLRRLIDVAREKKLHRITAELLPDNWGMQDVARQLGFRQPCRLILRKNA